MPHPSVRRWLAGIGAAVIVATSASPAVAADPDVKVDLRDDFVAVGHSLEIKPVVSTGEEAHLRNVVATYELIGLVDAVTVEKLNEGGRRCSLTSPTTYRCAESAVWTRGPERSHQLDSTALRAADNARPGTSGTLRVTVTADGVQPASTTAAITIAEPVNLAAGPQFQVSGKLGAPITVEASVRNTGGAAVDGVALRFRVEPAFEPVQQFRNCRYSTGSLAYCEFPQRLEPGQEYRVALPFRVAPTTGRPVVRAQYGWSTVASAQPTSGVPTLPGTGEELLLGQAARVGGAAVPQVDTDDRDDWAEVELTVENPLFADLAAVGAAVSGKAGDVVTATVGVENLGPARVDLSGRGDPVTPVRVTLPRGVSVVSVPGSCRRMDGDAAQFECDSAWSMEVGEKQLFDFVLKIDGEVTDARGPVQILPEDRGGGMYLGDRNPANNAATLVVNPAANAPTV